MRDLQNQKFLTFRALACGWLILALCDYFVLVPLWRLDRWLFMVGLSSHYIAWEGSVLTALIQNVLVALVGAGTGWIVGRTHRACAVPIAFALAASVGAYLAVPFGWVVYALVVFPHRQFVFWPSALLITVVAPSSVLLGALLSTRSRVKASS